MKVKFIKNSKNLDFYKIFKPELTPKKMLELGVFGGAYFSNNVREYPKSRFWIFSYIIAKISTSKNSKL